MRQNNKLNVEVEGGELALKNSYGDIVIIPKDKREWVEAKLQKGCYGCVDSLVETLPTATNYAENGLVVENNPSQAIPENTVSSQLSYLRKVLADDYEMPTMQPQVPEQRQPIVAAPQNESDGTIPRFPTPTGNPVDSSAQPVNPSFGPAGPMIRPPQNAQDSIPVDTIPPERPPIIGPVRNIPQGEISLYQQDSLISNNIQDLISNVNVDNQLNSTKNPIVQELISIAEEINSGNQTFQPQDSLVRPVDLEEIEIINEGLDDAEDNGIISPIVSNKVKNIMSLLESEGINLSNGERVSDKMQSYINDIILEQEIVRNMNPDFVRHYIVEDLQLITDKIRASEEESLRMSQSSEQPLSAKDRIEQIAIKLKQEEAKGSFNSVTSEQVLALIDNSQNSRSTPYTTQQAQEKFENTLSVFENNKNKIQSDETQSVIDNLKANEKLDSKDKPFTWPVIIPDIQERVNEVLQNEELKEKPKVVPPFSKPVEDEEKLKSEINKQTSIEDAVNTAREKLGSNQIFTWLKKLFTTSKPGEKFEPDQETIDKYNLNKENIEEQNRQVESPFTSKEQVKLQPGYDDWENIKKRTMEINKMENAEKINTYHKDKKDGSQYLIVDKENARMHLYRDGELIDSFEVIVGKNKSDAQTVTKIVNGKTMWSQGNWSTGAGIYTVSTVDPSSKEYYNLPSFTLKNEQGLEVSTAIHGTPYDRRGYYGDNDPSNNRKSYGCVNAQCTDLQELYSKYNLKSGDKVYILPEDEGNNFVYQDGQIIMPHSQKRQRETLTYKDTKGVERKGQGINFSKGSSGRRYAPIKIGLNEEQFKEEVFQKDNKRNRREFEETTKPFINALQENKEEIMSIANISSDLYNDIAKITFGIFGTETNYGDTSNLFMDSLRAINKTDIRRSIKNRSLVTKENVGGPTYKNEAKITTAPDKSIGLTQIKWIFVNDSEKEALAKFNITSNEDFLDPEKAAIGTAVILAIRYKEQLKPRERRDVLKYLPRKWNNRDNYSDRVNKNSKYLTIQQLKY